MEENEEWREIQGWPGYFVSRHGEVYSEKRDIMLKQSLVGGQPKVNLSNGWRGQETKLVHRLVGEAFLITPSNTRWVKLKHVDGDLLNNNVENLEWSENARE